MLLLSASVLVFGPAAFAADAFNSPESSDSGMWGPYAVEADGNVNASGWVGWVHPVNDWVWSYSLQTWAYLPVSAMEDSGGWLFACTSSSTTSFPDSARYLRQTPPKDAAAPFAPDLVGGTDGFFATERLAISEDGREIFFSQRTGYSGNDRAKTHRFLYDGEVWQGPTLMWEGFEAPAFSVDGQTLFVETTNQRSYKSVRTGDQWSAPAPTQGGNQQFLHYLQETQSGTWYASAQPPTGAGGMDWCTTTNPADPSLLRNIEGVSTNNPNYDFYVARDESYMILILRVGGYGLGDMFISYHEPDGSWTAPRNLGPKVNTSGEEYAPYVSPDGRCLFFYHSPSPVSNARIHWIEVGDLFDRPAQ